MKGNWLTLLLLTSLSVLLQHGQDANVRASSKSDCAVPGRSLPLAWNIHRPTTFNGVPSNDRVIAVQK